MKIELMLTTMALALLVMLLPFAGIVKGDIDPATVFIDAPNYVKTLGTLNVNVNISDVAGLYGWEFKLYFNNSILNYTAYTVAGHFLESSGYMTFPIDKSNNNYNATHGLVWIADTLVGAPAGVDGNGTLVTITFNVTNYGTVNLTFEDLLPSMPDVNVKLGDKSANQIQNVAIGKTMVVDATPPEITNVVQDPPADNVQPTDYVNVNATVTDTDSSVKNVTLYYSTDNAMTWNPILMTLLSDDIYNATIPPNVYGTYVQYKIVAYDEAENMAVNDNAGAYYVYHVIPEFPTLVPLILIIAVATLAAVLVKSKKYK